MRGAGRVTGGWRRILRAAAVAVVLGTAGGALAQSAQESWGQLQRNYDGRLTFVRLRWGGGGSFGFRGMSSAWNHDYPRAEEHLALLLKDITYIDARTDGSRKALAR